MANQQATSRLRVQDSPTAASPVRVAHGDTAPRRQRAPAPVRQRHLDQRGDELVGRLERLDQFAIRRAPAPASAPRRPPRGRCEVDADSLASA